MQPKAITSTHKTQERAHTDVITVGDEGPVKSHLTETITIVHQRQWVTSVLRVEEPRTVYTRSVSCIRSAKIEKDLITLTRGTTDNPQYN